jgi:DNA-binding NtrC family response regulator
LVAQHLFREDLYYRLKILEIHVPALRERGGDLLLLLEYLLRKFTQPSSPPWVTARALAALAQYPFPGNVRELSHAIQHAVIVSDGRQVDLEHLPLEIAGTEAAKHAKAGAQSRSLSEAVHEFEREYVRRALQQVKGRRTQAAQLLGISRKSLWERLRGYGISDSDLEAPQLPAVPANGKADDPTEG